MPAALHVRSRLDSCSGGLSAMDRLAVWLCFAADLSSSRNQGLGLSWLASDWIASLSRLVLFGSARLGVVSALDTSGCYCVVVFVVGDWFVFGASWQLAVSSNPQ